MRASRNAGSGIICKNRSRHGRLVSALTMTRRLQLQVCGIVQGVGFRPFIYSLARQGQLKGKVRNTPSGVIIDVEGEPASIETFITNIQLHPPAPARIDSIQRHLPAIAESYEDFSIPERYTSARCC